MNALDPDRIYVGGEITTAWDLLEPTVRAALGERALLAVARRHRHRDRRRPRTTRACAARRRAHRRARLRGIGRGVRTAAAVLLAWGAPPPAEPSRSRRCATTCAPFLAARAGLAPVATIATLDPPPDRVHGALDDRRVLLGHVPARDRRLGRGERRRRRSPAATSRTTAGRRGPGGGGAGRVLVRAALRRARAARASGRDLQTNALWQSLDERQRTAWKRLLDSTRSSTIPRTRKLDRQAENYLGVAARIAPLSHEHGPRTGPGRARTRCSTARRAVRATAGSTRTTRRRTAASTATRTVRALRLRSRGPRPDAGTSRSSCSARRCARRCGSTGTWSRRTAMRTPGAAASASSATSTASSSPRSSADEPDLRPAPLADLAAAFAAAWRWLRTTTGTTRTCCRCFASGRGSYAYITPRARVAADRGIPRQADRGAGEASSRRSRARGVTEIPDRVPMAPVARYVSFANGDRPGGRLGRAPAGRCASPVPFTSRTTAGPGGLPARAARPARLRRAGGARERRRSRRSSSSKVGARSSTADGADAIEPDRGRPAASQRAGTGWALVGGREGQREDVGVTSTVTWRLEGGRLRCRETIAAERPITLRRVRIRGAGDGARCEAAGEADALRRRRRASSVSSPRSARSTCALRCRPAATVPLAAVRARGIPFHRVYEAEDVRGRARPAASAPTSSSKSNPRRLHDRRRRDRSPKRAAWCATPVAPRPARLGRARLQQRAPPALRAHDPAGAATRPWPSRPASTKSA